MMLSRFPVQRINSRRSWVIASRLNSWVGSCNFFHLSCRGSWQRGSVCGNHDRSISPDYNTRFLSYSSLGCPGAASPFVTLSTFVALSVHSAKGLSRWAARYFAVLDVTGLSFLQLPRESRCQYIRQER